MNDIKVKHTYTHQTENFDMLNLYSTFILGILEYNVNCTSAKSVHIQSFSLEWEIILCKFIH